MSAADESRPDQTPHGQPTTPAVSDAHRRRGRLIVPALILLAIVVVFLIIILVGNFA